MLDMNRLSDDVTEIIARAILYKDRQKIGACSPSTDDWADLYSRGYAYNQLPSSQGRNDSLTYNLFRAEVDSITAMVMRSVYERGQDLRTD